MIDAVRSFVDRHFDPTDFVPCSLLHKTVSLPQTDHSVAALWRIRSIRQCSCQSGLPHASSDDTLRACPTHGLL